MGRQAAVKNFSFVSNAKIISESSVFRFSMIVASLWLCTDLCSCLSIYVEDCVIFQWNPRHTAAENSSPEQVTAWQAWHAWRSLLTFWTNSQFLSTHLSTEFSVGFCQEHYKVLGAHNWCFCREASCPATPASIPIWHRWRRSGLAAHQQCVHGQQLHGVVPWQARQATQCNCPQNQVQYLCQLSAWSSWCLCWRTPACLLQCHTMRAYHNGHKTPILKGWSKSLIFKGSDCVHGGKQIWHSVNSTLTLVEVWAHCL